MDRSAIRLRALQARKGDSNVTSTAVTTAAVGVFVPVAAPLFLLRKGHDIVVPEGTRVDAFVDGDHLVTTEIETAPAPVSTAGVLAVRAVTSLGPAPPAPPRAPLTNADIVALVGGRVRRRADRSGRSPRRPGSKTSRPRKWWR